jgi:hypothetical protein
MSISERLTGTLFGLFFHLSASLIVHKSEAGADWPAARE